MSKSLGIFVTNPDQFRHVMGITKAAKAKGAKVKVFFTWDATHNTKKEADFPELCKIADDVSICADSYKNMGYDVNDIPEGLEANKMGTQAQHGIIIEDYDCYLSL
jgi:peroxiredoxin family protein